MDKELLSVDLELKRLLLESLESAKAGIGGAVDFVMAEAPILVKELLVWNFTFDLLQFLLFVPLLIGGFLVFKKMHPHIQENKGGTEPVELLYVVPLGFFLTSTVTFFSNLDWLKILIAPKLYLFEYAASLAQ